MPPDTTESDPSASASSGAACAATEPLACVSCRARKLKCDRTKPACSRCLKVSNDCVYPESRRKPTFKRRNVKELEARLAQVEDYLKEVNKTAEDKTDDGSPVHPAQPDTQFSNIDFSSTMPQTDGNSPERPQVPFIIPDLSEQPDPVDQPFSGQLMGLGMTESLPPDDVMEDLRWSCQIRPVPRSLLPSGEAGHGEVFISISHTQAWGLIAFYEAKVMLFTRSTMSGARCVRLCHMIGLDRLDGDPLGMPPSLGPPLTWAELEERRRVFWGAFSIDAHCSISTGWSSLINTDDIATRLPSSEDAFLSDRKEEAPFLEDVFTGAQYTGFAGTVITCQIFKIILRHVHRSRPDDRCDDVMNGSFWTRHRELDNTLSSLFMFLPEKFRLPENIRDASALHFNLNLHASVICLHHAAVEKAEKHNLPDHVKQNSIARLRASAEEVVSIIRLNTHAALFFRSPLCALSLYCTTTVYVYLAKQNPTSGLTSIDLSNLDLIVQSMEAIARTHTITRAFLQQACLDIENHGLELSIRMPNLKKYRTAFSQGKSHIPMLVRNAITKHTEQSPLFIRNGRTLEAGHGALSCVPQGTDEVDGHRPGKDCFQAMLGAVTRNVAPPKQPDPTTHKRKRMSPSPGPEMMGNQRESMLSSLGASGTNLRPRFTDTGTWPSSWSPRVTSGSISLPDRTNSSSASSPANQGSGTRTISGSSHTSPDIGLGNTAEENRIDLRAFQDRISTPIWQSTEETLFAQITESMVANALSSDGVDPWGILNADLSWDGEGMPTVQ
ncbi:Zn(II)2Cys6 transcriptional activator [Fusarium albosuccineum]|uniref:Zn(II)2Cys6 transcriptional activator n=1 Tax=Fusarium albosuccineum TaxID=1237068 RepID=A0A8H4P891_9HYPO|nr:Zn(II)2Cys6 transcriptional activator [Fusarium albosuccineum]